MATPEGRREPLTEEFVARLEVAADAEVVFEACRNVREWSSFMPAVRVADFVDEGELSDIVTITAEANDQMWTWRSRRIVDRAERTITFERIGPQHPIVRMGGQWRIHVRGDVVDVELRHTFEIAEGFPREAAFLREATSSNSRRDLEALRLHCSKE